MMFFSENSFFCLFSDTDSCSAMVNFCHSIEAKVFSQILKQSLLWSDKSILMLPFFSEFVYDYCENNACSSGEFMFDSSCASASLIQERTALLPGSFHLSFFVIFGDKVTKISCHFQAKTVQLSFLFFVIYEKRK